MDIEKKVPKINNYIKPDMPTIGPTEKSHECFIVPDLMLRFGTKAKMIKNVPKIMGYIIRTIRQIYKSYRVLSNQPKNSKRMISEQDILDLHALLYKLTIHEVGYAQVNPSHIFSNRMILFKNAIVLIMEMNHDIISTAPSLKAYREIFRIYLKQGIAVNKITKFLKSRGYRSEAGPALGGEVNYPLLAMKAGLGFIGTHGLLITKRFGPSVRIAAVYTDIENLPENKNNEHAWIGDFCKKCGKCVRKCPAQAIYEVPKVFDDKTEQHIDYKKCIVPFSNNYACSICIKECVFFNGDYDKIRESN